jgi:RNA polymerase sigma-70 factor (ECF subfamily)
MHKSMETAPLDEPLPAGSASTGDRITESAAHREETLGQAAPMNHGAAVPGDAALSRHPGTPLPSFEALFETYYRPLASFLYRMLGDLQLAQDITQDCFVKLHLAMKNGQALENVRAWLYRVATNAALDERRRKRIAWLPLLASSERDEEFLDPEEQVVLRDRLQQVLAGISPNLSVCLLLHLHHGFSHDEIANILGISSGAARTRLQRAREAFKARWLALEERSGAGRSTAAARQHHTGKAHGGPPRDRRATEADQQHGGHTTHESHAI